jgi:MFS family permease
MAEQRRRSPLLETLRGLVIPVYLPWMTGGLGVAMIIPVLPVYLKESGLSFTLVSVVLAATGLGAMMGGLPSGALLGRFGENRVMVLSLVLMGGATAGLGISTAVVGLTILRFVHGAGSIGMRLSRQTFVTRKVTADVRGRSLALMGGSMRFATLIGPVIGGVLADRAGYTWTFAISGLVTFLGLIPVLISGIDEGFTDERPDVAEPEPRPTLWAVLKRHRRALFVGGVGPALVMSVRQGRLIILPLMGDALDLSNSAIGLMVAVGTGADLLLFPVAGYLMDRFGRLSAMVPAFSLIGVGLVVLSTADTAVMVTIAGVIMGIGNGMSSGTMLTLGSDLAPQDSPGQFLSALASIQNLGRIIGPLLVGWFADAVGLRASAVALAVVMFIAIVWIVVLIGETGTRRATTNPA